MYRQTPCKCWLKPAAGIAVPRMSAFFPTYRIEKLSDNSALIDAGVGFQQVHKRFRVEAFPHLTRRASGSSDNRRAAFPSFTRVASSCTLLELRPSDHILANELLSYRLEVCCTAGGIVCLTFG